MEWECLLVAVAVVVRLDSGLGFVAVRTLEVVEMLEVLGNLCSL